MDSPSLVSIPRITTLVASTVVALASGTNYVYSAYAPQLGAKLQISHTRLNIIGLAGNFGVYSSGPLWGRIADTRSPRLLLPLGFMLLLVGYYGIRQMYTSGSPGSFITFLFLSIFSFLTGAGGDAGLCAAVNTTARSFPDKTRATVTGIVLSGFGLSAFLFSTISHLAFEGSDSVPSFLLLLSLGTSMPYLVGYFLMHIIPLPSSESLGLENGMLNPGYGETAAPEEINSFSVAWSERNSSHSPLLDDGGDASSVYSEDPATDIAAEYTTPAPRLSSSLELACSPRPRRRSRSSGRSKPEGPNIYGKALIKCTEFWIMCIVVSLTAGTGIMYINNVGSISLALSAHNNPSYDKALAARYQATQVSSISLTNFLGRIVIGLIADLTKKFKMPRSYCMSLVALTFIASQMVVARIDDVKDLWMGSLLLGLAYGSVWGMAAPVTIEWFGLVHFSENWGYLMLSPLVGGNTFSVAFGRNLDAHTPLQAPIKARGGIPADTDHLCLDGRACYISSLYMTIGACVVALGVSLWAGWRDRRKMLMAETYARIRDDED